MIKVIFYFFVLLYMLYDIYDVRLFCDVYVLCMCGVGFKENVYD